MNVYDGVSLKNMIMTWQTLVIPLASPVTGALGLALRSKVACCLSCTPRGTLHILKKQRPVIWFQNIESHETSNCLPTVWNFLRLFGPSKSKQMITAWHPLPAQPPGVTPAFLPSLLPIKGLRVPNIGAWTFGSAPRFPSFRHTKNEWQDHVAAKTY